MARRASPSAAGFKITGAKGFHITFDNGHTVSVQFGPGNYSDNYNMSSMDFISANKPDIASGTAEVAAWGPDGHWHRLGNGDDVVGYLSPSDVLAILFKIAALQIADAEASNA